MTTITIPITDFGTAGDRECPAEAVIQNAIDACHAAGGGSVTVPPGVFSVGSIELKENVLLCLEAGAILRASSTPADYRKVFPEANTLVSGQHDSPFNLDQYLIFARNVRNVGLVGDGVIDAQGTLFYNKERKRSCSKHKAGGEEYTLCDWRPGPTVCFIDCEDVKVRDITILDNPMFALALLHCRAGQIRGVKIKSDTHVVNGDGIHLKSSKDIFISGCLIEAEDDALCFYTDNWAFACERGENSDCTGIAVSDCICSSSCCGIRFGYMGDGKLGNITIHNVIIKRAKTAIDFICNGGISCFDAVTRDFPGTRIENIRISNLIAEDCIEGVRMNLHPSASGGATIREIHFVNTSITACHGNFICGNAKQLIENVSFTASDFRITGERKGKMAKIPDPLPIFASKEYPGYSFVIRHCKNVTFHNCRITPAEILREGDSIC